MSSGRAHRFPVGVPGVLLAAILAGCVPVEGGPPDMADVEDHLGLVVGYLPEGCDPIGLGGDGRGRVLGAGFDCGEDTGLRIERLDADSIDVEVASSPAETAPGRIEWGDETTGDVIRVSSEDLSIDVLTEIAGSIDFRD